MANEPVTPEAKLLTAAMNRRRWKVPRLAQEANLSEGWVRAQVLGQRNVGKGKYKATDHKALTVAQIAATLGNVTPQQLIDIGRPDAAAALVMLTEEAGGPAGSSAEGSRLRQRLVAIRNDIDSLITELPGDS